MADEKKRNGKGSLIAVAAVVLLGALLWILRGRLSLDWSSLGRQIRAVSAAKVVAGVVVIHLCYWLRAVRWRVLLGAGRTATSLELLPSQVIGFTAVALFGRIADLARPYLVARKLRTTVTSQLAIYSIERAFDLGAAAILFSVTLVFAPHDMPHHEAFARAGVLSLVATVALAAFAVALRLHGLRLAALCGKVAGKFSAPLGKTVAARVAEFSAGLRVIAGFGEFAYALFLSLLMWAGVAACYCLSARAFRADATLASFSIPATMLMMVTAMGGSLLQVPVVGWFTTIGVLAAALRGFFGVPVETASACGALMFAITNLAIVPGGLLAARIEGIGLRDVATAAPQEES